MLPFIRVTIAMLSLHSNRNPKTLSHSHVNCKDVTKHLRTLSLRIVSLLTAMPLLHIRKLVTAQSKLWSSTAAVNTPLLAVMKQVNIWTTDLAGGIV